MDAIIFQDAAKYGNVLKGIVLVSLFVAIVCGANVIKTDPSHQVIFSAIGIIAFLIIVGAFFWAILHRRYLIFDDRLEIVRGWPFSTTVPFDDVACTSAAPREGWRPGRRISLGNKNGVSIHLMLPGDIVVMQDEKTVPPRDILSPPDDILIYPGNRDEFLGHLNNALTEWKKKKEDIIEEAWTQ